MSVEWYGTSNPLLSAIALATAEVLGFKDGRMFSLILPALLVV